MASTVTVKRSGEVTVNGTVAGRVEKIEAAGPFGSTRTEWLSYSASGELLGTGCDTRKRAVDRVTDNVAPLQATDAKRVEGWSGPFISVRVSVKGMTMFVSRYATESVWVIDALFMPGSMMPAFSNGEGTRCTAVRALKGEMADAATAAATTASVWPMA